MSASAINPMLSQRHPFHLKKIAANVDDLIKVLRVRDELLDAGCCEGHLYDKLRHPKYTGIDLYPPNIKEARSRQPGIQFEIGDIFSQTRQWDVVFCCRVLMHLPDFEKNISKLRRMARRILLAVIPIGPESCTIENTKGHPIEFRTFSRERVLETHPLRVRMHQPYATVIYDPNLS